MIIDLSIKKQTNQPMENLGSNLYLDIIKVSEAAAIASANWIGRGDEKQADQAAVNAMREILNTLNIDGRVVIGEGERDEAPMLYIGEKVGTGLGEKIDIALDPLEGTTICATGGAGSLAVIAMAREGGFLHAPDVYMDKIAVGPGYPEGIIDLDNSVKRNLENVAKAKKCLVEDLLVVILKRERHAELIAKVREAGARIQLISDGDIAGVIATTNIDSGVDIYMGSGGAPEGVLAAAALRATGGQIMGRLLFSNDLQRERAKQMGIMDLNRKYITEEMAKGEVIFAATGVTNGAMLEGVRKNKNNIFTNSVLMDSSSKSVRYIKTYHNII